MPHGPCFPGPRRDDVWVAVLPQDRWDLYVFCPKIIQNMVCWGLGFDSSNVSLEFKWRCAGMIGIPIGASACLE